MVDIIVVVFILAVVVTRTYYSCPNSIEKAGLINTIILFSLSGCIQIGMIALLFRWNTLVLYTFFFIGFWTCYINMIEIIWNFSEYIYLNIYNYIEKTEYENLSDIFYVEDI